MRATLTAGQLRAALAPACDVVPKYVTIPVLSFVKLQVDSSGKVLCVIAQDLDAVMWRRTDVSGEPGEVLAPCRALYSIVNSASPDEFVTLTTNKDRLIIDFRDARFSLLTIPTKDFPDITWASNGSAESSPFMVPVGWMQNVLGRAEQFISTEETRYYLNGVCWHVHDKGLAIVATDGHRLARILSDIECSAELGNSKIILPRYSVRFLVRNVKSATRVYLASGKLTMCFEAQNLRYATKLIDGTFPDYTRVLPQGTSDYSLVVDSNKLLAALRRVTSFGAKTFTFSLSGKRLVACANGFDSGATIAVPGTSNGLLEPVTMNASYLQTICRAAKGKTIDIAFRGAGEPIAVKEGRDLFVQMPMRGSGTGFVELPAGALAA